MQSKYIRNSIFTIQKYLRLMKHSTKLTSKAIQGSGLPSDYKKAIAEYIWNGFDANATEIQIQYKADVFGNLQELSIIDNGEGINIDTIQSTFGQFMVSEKANYFSQEGFVKGKKGKGRFSFYLFANNSTWITKFKNKEKILEYSISISKDTIQDFDISDKVISKSILPGTEVKFTELHDIVDKSLENEDFKTFLSNEFGWFLFLNKELGYNILINNEPLDYFSVIADSDEFTLTINDIDFKISFLRWSNKIGDKYYYYFLNSKKIRKHKQHTSFNNKAVDFHHSVYIQSNYFDDFHYLKNDVQIPIEGKSQSDKTFKKLTSDLNEYLTKKQKNYVKLEKANLLIEGYNKDGIFPDFKANPYEQLRKQDLENVVRELYATQPRIFLNLKREQQKTIVGFLNLLLDSEQREHVLEIVENVISLTDEEREELASVLRNSKLTHITALIKFLENRFNVVAALKTLIYDLTRFTNERDDIQKIIESNYWLFGEQYHLVSADKNFEITANNYLSFLEENNNRQPEIIKLDKKDKLRRPDIFICQKAFDYDRQGDLIEENIIVELKRPDVIVGKTQFSQIEDYLNFITNEPNFNSELRKWKFILVGISVDGFIKGYYKNQETKGKKFLVQSINNYEIYAMTWDDVFSNFDRKHRHLIDRLEFSSAIIEDLESKGISLNREGVKEIKSNLLNIETNLKNTASN